MTISSMKCTWRRLAKQLWRPTISSSPVSKPNSQKPANAWRKIKRSCLPFTTFRLNIGRIYEWEAGQERKEINPETYAVCKADMILKGVGESADHIVGGAEWSTLSHDAFPAQEFDFLPLCSDGRLSKKALISSMVQSVHFATTVGRMSSTFETT